MDGSQPLFSYVGPKGEAVVQLTKPGLAPGYNRVFWRVGSKARLIDDFSADGHHQWQILNADYDGRWLAYSVLDNPSDTNDWSIWIWDTVNGGDPRMIGSAGTSSDGGHPGGPWPYIALVNGSVYWPQVPAGKAGDITSYLRRYQIGQARRSNVTTKGFPIRVWRLDDNTIIWTAAPEEGEWSRLEAADGTTLKPVTLPRQFTDIVGPFAFAGSKQLYAWSDHSLRTLYVWKPGWTRPKAAIKVGAAHAIDNIGVIADNYVVWNDGARQSILDVRNGTYAPLTKEWGSIWTGIDSSWLVVSYPPKEKGKSPSTSSYLNTAKLPGLPAC